VQERQSPPFDFEKLTLTEQGALQQVRARRARSLVAATGATLLALFAIGCPEPGDLQNPGAFPAPTPVGGTAATAGGSGGGTAGPSCESACMKTIIDTAGTGCKACHGVALKIAGTLDFETPGYSARLKDKPAEHAGLAAGTACPMGDKLIDSAKPAESWLLKKVTNMQGACGTNMPLGVTLSATDQACFTTYVNCVAGGAAPAGGGGSASGGTASGGTASGGTASGGTASGGTASGGTATSGSGGTGGT
jgi:hypothetical protein